MPVVIFQCPLLLCRGKVWVDLGKVISDDQQLWRQIEKLHRWWEQELDAFKACAIR